MIDLYVLSNYDAPHLIDEVVSRLDESPGVGTLDALAFGTHSELSAAGEKEYDTIDTVRDVIDGRGTEYDPRRVEELERRYGDPTLRTYITADERYIDAPHDRQLAVVQAWFDHFERVFERRRPDVLLLNRVDSTPAWIALAVLDEYGGTTVWWKETRVGARYAVVRDDAYDTLTEVHELFHRLRDESELVDEFPDAAEQAHEYAAQFDEEAPRPEYFARRASTFGGSLWSAFVPNRLRKANGPVDAIESFTESPSDLNSALTRYSSRVSSRVKTAISRPFDPPGENFSTVYFPLHAQPEYSTLVLGQMYINQVALVEQVSRSLPIRHTLYVKEHPRMYRDNPRPSAVYERIASLPNVRLLPPDTDSHYLIRESELVVTVSGTAAFEALLYDTPSVTFGRPHYNVLSDVYRPQGPEAIAPTVATALDVDGIDDEELHAYLTALFARSVEAPTSIPQMSPDQQRSFASSIVPEVRRTLFE